MFLYHYNCKTLPVHLPEADCSIFTLSVGRSVGRRLSSRFVTINSTSIKPSMKVRNITYAHHIILSASSERPQCIIIASSVYHKCIISASSGNHQGNIKASSGQRQGIISASSVHTQRIISASSAHNKARPDHTRPVQTRPDQRSLPSRGPNSKTCVLVNDDFIHF